MGESHHIPDWKIPYGSAEEIQQFEKNGRSYLHSFSELFYWCFKMTQIIKKGYTHDTLTKNLFKAFADCKKTIKYYMLGAIFFIDIDTQTTLESLNRINNVIIEMKDPKLDLTSGFVHIFLGFISEKLGRTLSKDLAFKTATQHFPQNSRYCELAVQQMRGERSFKDWVHDCLIYFNLHNGNFFSDFEQASKTIDLEEFSDEFTDKEEEISVEDYEQKFLKQYSKEKKENTHVRRCPHCNYFMIAEGTGEKKCPRCHKAMNFALYCPSCGIWYSVKTPKKYMCPTCGNLMIKKNNI